MPLLCSRLFNDMLRDKLNKCVFVYLDNILTNIQSGPSNEGGLPQGGPLLR